MASGGQTADLLFVGFNQDATSLQVGMHFGYTIYNLKSIENVPVEYTEPSEEGIRYVERFFASSLVAYVLHKSPRKICAYHFVKRHKVCTQIYKNTVMAIKMNRNHLIVCLEESITIHCIRDLKIEHQIRDVPENKRGVIDVTSDGAPFIAYPGAAETGRVSLFDLTKMAPSSTFSAHTSPLAALSFNSDGKLLATASTKGTVIRVFNVQTCERCFEFTRGVKRYVTINSLAFSNNSKYLCSSSNTETVHVFKLEKPPEECHVQHDDATWTDYFTKAASCYLPTHMNDLFYREKSFATARLPTAGPKSVVALRVIDGKLYLLVATADGFLYCYFVDPNGGECSLERQHKTGNQTDRMLSGDERCAISTGAPEKEAEDEEDLPLNDLNEIPPIDHSVR